MTAGGWDRGDAAEWAPVPASTVQTQRENAAAYDRLTQPGWDRTNADEWAKPTEPESAVRWGFVVLAFALIVAGGVLGAVGSIPGAVNGATVVMFVLGAAGVFLIVREIRR